MTEPSDAKLRASRKLLESTKAPDTSKAMKHKKWVKQVEGAKLASLLQHNEADVRKTLKDAGFDFTVEELELPALAPTPVTQQVVLYKREGKLVGYAVGATSTDAQES
jgi:hypothetical protein